MVLKFGRVPKRIGQGRPYDAEQLLKTREWERKCAAKKRRREKLEKGRAKSGIELVPRDLKGVV